MKQVLIEAVAGGADVPDVGAPASGEVVFDVVAFPINSATSRSAGARID